MNFREAESYLLSLGNEVETMKLGLESMRRLIAGLGRPLAHTLKVQVAGTNGKGSVCAYLESICRAAALRTGLYTSPHLVSITERIQINGEAIGQVDFARIASAVRQICEELVACGELASIPTFFEQVTAIAMIAFANCDVDIAILETGLGGRLDATTAAGAGIAAIARIDLDHQEYLGDTIEEIAAEKAGIITETTADVIVGSQAPEAFKVIVNACEHRGITPVLAAEIDVGQMKLGLQGQHQIENAQVAIGIARVLRSRFTISDENILNGLENARHPGRLEFQGQFLFDGAHNVGGAKALREFLDKFVDAPVTLIFGAMKGKDVQGFAQELFPKAGTVILTHVDTLRAMTPQEILVSISTEYADVELTDGVAEALEKANDLTDENGTILVTGSLYLVGEVKKLLRSQI